MREHSVMRMEENLARAGDRSVKIFDEHYFVSVLVVHK